MEASNATEQTAAKSRTTIERTSDRELVVKRTLDAPPRIVFEAWTKPELLMKWWAPKSMGVVMVACENDVRAGGTYRFTFQHGDKKMEFFGKYIEVKPPTRIVWTNDEAGQAGPVSTLTLEEKNGKTLLTMHELYPSKEALDEAGTGMAEGLQVTFTQLDELLASLV